jgi:predicted nucleic acid-binding protein
LKVFVDSNIPRYAAGADHPHKSSSRRFLEQIRAGKLEACTSTEVPVDRVRPAVAGVSKNLSGDKKAANPKAGGLRITV